MKTPLSYEVVCVWMVDFETSSSKLDVSKSNSWKITSFSKTMTLQKELFLTMFYTTNLSLLLVTKKAFMLIIILSNYQQCPRPFRTYIVSSILIYIFFLQNNNCFLYCKLILERNVKGKYDHFLINNDEALIVGEVDPRLPTPPTPPI